MTEREKKLTLADIPDLGKLDEKGVSINTPTPTQFSIPDPWTPSSNNEAAPTDGPATSVGPASTGD